MEEGRRYKKSLAGMALSGMVILTLILSGCSLFSTNNVAANDALYLSDNQIPNNGSVDIALTPVCVVSIMDFNSSEWNVSIYENSSGSFQLVKQFTNEYSLIYFTYENATSYGTTYGWKVVVSDGINQVSETYHFTTIQEGFTPNHPPVANFTYSVDGTDLTVNSTSTDPDGSITSYTWLFGDGNSEDGQNIENTTHSYSAMGYYNVTLVVFDNSNNSADYITKRIAVGNTSDGSSGIIDTDSLTNTQMLLIGGAILIVLIFGGAVYSKTKG